MKRLLVAVSVGVFVGSIGCAMLTVCAPQEVSAKPIPKEINIGTTLAVTGHFSTTWGPKAKAFHEAYEKLINREGGIYVKEYDAELPIKLTIYDDGSDGVRNAQLITQKGGSRSFHSVTIIMTVVPVLQRTLGLVLTRQWQ